MTNRIVVSVPTQMKVALADTILKRPDLRVEYQSTPDLEGLVRNPPQMLIVFDGTAGGCTEFLEELTRIFPSLKFPIVVLVEGDSDRDYPDTVKATFRKRFRVGEFNLQVANLLGLPLRRSRRFLVHLTATVSHESTSMLATVVKISGSGCLLECGDPLPAGQDYDLEIVGLPDFAAPRLTVRIVREEPSPVTGGVMRYFSAEFTGIELIEMEAIVDRLIG